MTDCEKLADFRSKMKVAKVATYYSDCCGRSCRSDAVYLLDKKYKDEFLAFVNELAKRTDSELIAACADGTSRIKCHITLGYHDGRYNMPGIYRDYDGITECDRAEKSYGGEGWIMLSFAEVIAKKRKVCVDWWSLKCEDKVVLVPNAPYGFTAYYPFDPYSADMVMDRNIICFV